MDPPRVKASEEMSGVGWEIQVDLKILGSSQEETDQQFGQCSFKLSACAKTFFSQVGVSEYQKTQISTYKNQVQAFSSKERKKIYLLSLANKLRFSNWCREKSLDKTSLSVDLPLSVYAWSITLSLAACASLSVLGIETGSYKSANFVPANYKLRVGLNEV